MDEEYTIGMVLLYYLIWVSFVGDDLNLACNWTKCDVSFKTMLLPLHLNLVCNNYVEIRCILNYLWNGYSMWLVCWIMYDLGCMLVGLKSFMVSSDYQVYMGSSMTIWSLWWLPLYLCSYKLDGSITPNEAPHPSLDMLPLPRSMVAEGQR
jgi:hypothetical protein